MAIARGLGTSKGKMNFSANRRRVDVSNSGIQIAHGCECLVDVASVDRRRQTVFNVVGNLDRVLEVLARNDRDNRSENFFLRDAHLGIDIAEYGRLHEKAMTVVALVQAIAAALQLCTFGLADINILKVALQLAFIDRRAHICGLVETIADPKLLGPLYKAAHELAIHAFLRND